MKWKCKEEVGLKKFEDVEIIYTIIGIIVTITQKTILKLLRAPEFGRFVVGTKDNNPKTEAIKSYLFDNAENLCSSDFGKVKNM